ncbi:hypothetical protein JQ554_23410 [Bradyrhizobium diazoefficiens]|nr:hypothetical protein [Bradyrhizobium diazoefficiens]MBR0967002.1 hypothetical protein [Bradyrhizobium diazoefficiens]MBR0979126.1 hypothetical protein [Bradyrhizobium diazoefficiens]MBR1009985.1 hypothetical protein [Bradyrhizobium diazoefficiens]MBR1016563.1 hypothetical protein [Bradyrhizobium diazoefficiens]MBR1053823.1 hypothetical protein [Bradyrhizobium diazoefficiens]
MSTTLETDTDRGAAEQREIEHFVHAPGSKPQVVLGMGSDTLRDALLRLKVIADQPGGLHVFIGECVEVLDKVDDVDDGSDLHEPVDIDLTLAVLEIHRHRHVHVHHCRHIAVAVHFGGKSKRHRFVPNTTVGVVTEWARRKFPIDPAIAGEYVLQLAGSSVQPRSDEHLGDLVHGDVCGIEFDLVKELTPKG